VDIVSPWFGMVRPWPLKHSFHSFHQFSMQGLILDFLVSLDTLNITQPPRLCLLQLLIKDVTMELNAGPSEFGGTYHRHP
jgi:hypothetical protein